MSESEKPSGNLLFILITGLILWGLLLAVGTIFNTNKFDIRKPLIVVGVIGTFALIWITALRQAKKKNPKHNP